MFDIIKRDHERALYKKKKTLYLIRFFVLNNIYFTKNKYT